MPSFDWEIANRYRRRLKLQAGYQREHRKDLKARKLPDREEVAKVVLAMALDSMNRNPAAAEKWLDKIARCLAAEGFDGKEAAERIRAMAARHLSKRRGS